MSVLVLYQLVALMLLCIGLFGIVWRKSLVGMLICVELMLNGAGLSIASAAQLTDTSAAMGQLATLLVMGLAAAEATLALAIIVVVVKRFKQADSETVTLLKG